MTIIPPISGSQISLLKRRRGDRDGETYHCNAEVNNFFKFWKWTIQNLCDNIFYYRYSWRNAITTTWKIGHK